MSTPADTPAAADAELDLTTSDAVVGGEELHTEAGDPEAVAGGRTDLPLEADPADVAEQDAAVPYDEDEQR